MYTGDFNAQQIPFNYYAAKYIQDGGGTYSWATDIGSGFKNSYSFYVIGSPLFWIIKWIPARIVPYMMYPLLIVKFALIGGGAYLWISRYVKDQNYAVAGAIMYAFSGFMVSAIFFNHFLDAVLWWGYILWALDTVMYEDKGIGLFAVFVALSLNTNYFFFFGNVVFLIIYYILNVVKGEYKLTLKKFSKLALASVSGVMMGATFAIPAAFDLMGNPRLGSVVSGLDALIYSCTQQYLAIISSFFVPPDPEFANVIFPKASENWASLSAYLPGLSAAGVIAYFIINKKREKCDALCWVLGTSVVFSLIPIFNASFSLFNSVYYARWFFMPLLVASCVTAKALEEDRKEVENNLKYMIYVTIGFALIGMLGDIVNAATCAFVGILLLAKTISTFKSWSNSESFSRKMIGCVAFCGAMLTFITAYTTFDRSNNAINVTIMNNATQVQKEYWPQEDVDYRIDNYSTLDYNIGLYTGMSSVKSFTSTPEASIIKFYKNLGLRREVRSYASAKHGALYTFLGVKYAVRDIDEMEYIKNRNDKDDIKIIEQKMRDEDETKNEGIYKLNNMFNLEKFDYLWHAGNVGRLDVFENKYFAGVGFVYDYYITEDAYNELTMEQKECALLKAVVLMDDDVEKYKGLFKGELDVDTIDTGAGGYYEDAERLKEHSCNKFKMNNYGFDAEIDTEKEELIVFSVPWSKGWSAEINGEKTDIIEVDYGMVGIKTQMGKNAIKFTYKTYGEDIGKIIAMAGAGLFAILLAIDLSDKRKTIA